MTLRALLRDPHFRHGARDMLAFGPALAAWGLVTGVAMNQSGLGVGLSVLMTLLVFAGTSQLAALPLFASGAPMWVIWASAFCVNLRFLVFSAEWRVYLGRLTRGRRLLLGYFIDLARRPPVRGGGRDAVLRMAAGHAGAAARRVRGLPALYMHWH